MNNPEDHTPITPEDLLAYLAGSVSPAREREIERAIADNPNLAASAHDLFRFSHLIDQWPASATAAPAWQTRLSRIESRLGLAVEGAVAVVLEARDRGSRILTEVLGSLNAPQHAWQFAPQMATRGTEDESVYQVSAQGKEAQIHCVVEGDTLLVRMDRLPEMPTIPTVILMQFDTRDEPEEINKKKLHPPPDWPDAPYLVAEFHPPDGNYLLVISS